MKRIKDKTQQVELYLQELQTIIPCSLEEYKGSLIKKAACERYVEKIVEATVDLAFILIKLKKFRVPEDDSDAFTILQENNFLSPELAKRLKNAKGMRNIIAHQYGKLDDKTIFESIKNNLGEDC